MRLTPSSSVMSRPASAWKAGSTGGVDSSQASPPGPNSGGSGRA
jgi:hypothetical protein